MPVPGIQKNFKSVHGNFMLQQRKVVIVRRRLGINVKIKWEQITLVGEVISNGSTVRSCVGLASGLRRSCVGHASARAEGYTIEARCNHKGPKALP